MDQAAIIYGSTTGCTAEVADRIAQALYPLCRPPVSIRYGRVDAMLACDALILGIPTWGIGDLQDDWERARNRLSNEHFHGKLVALFGLGDQLGFPDHFLDGMGVLYELLRDRGARFVGQWPVDGYDFQQSRAVVDGRFVGLALDENGQGHLTDERIRRWTDQIRPAFEAHLGGRPQAAGLDRR